MQNIINWGSSTLGDALWPEPALVGARWSPQNDFNETLYANIVCIYIQTYTCVTVSYMYAWLFVQRANKVNNRFMSLLKKDNRWVATAFYFTFFPPLWHSPPTVRVVVGCVVFFGFHCVCLCGARDGIRPRLAVCYVCVWHLCKRCHKNFRRTVAKTHHQLQQQLRQRAVTTIIKGSNSLALSNRLPVLYMLVYY